MTKRMLIDATHPEENRIVVVSGTRVEEFDFETSTKKRIKGNVYLAKVTRVEPSLQAAFVDYGGTRHGFLAFNEIHPDYYQIPVADRKALVRAVGALREDEELREETAAEAKEAADSRVVETDETMTEEAGDGAEEKAETEVEEEEKIETVGGDEMEEIARRRIAITRRYKIQEVIKRGQILLVQVVKEERGGKGAALTTFLSLAGLYCVLMPNALRSAGGISRRIPGPKDRQRLKAIMHDLDVPEGMAVILRTNAMEHSKTEIRRDHENLLRLWDEIRRTTLKSVAPCLVYEESNLVKRAIRDIYTRDVEEVLVEGEEGYKTAKAYMKLLMPSHARKVQPYRDSSIPLFHRYQVESQLDAIHDAHVQLRSGGYLVIHPTEALVAVDVNSGRATRERNIEQTALKTNLEAAEEIARQLRLRDLGGLIVVDFIDMEVPKNRRAIERRLKEAMKTDRARTQIGRISLFGMLEMSRQRLRPSVLEASAATCPTCGGVGTIRSTESTALHVLRAIEEEGMRQRSDAIDIAVSTEVAFYLLNAKRVNLSEIEARHGLRVTISTDDSLVPPNYRLEQTVARSEKAAEEEAVEEGEGKRRRRPRRRRRKVAEAGPVAVAAGETVVAPLTTEEAVGTEVPELLPAARETAEEVEQMAKKRRRRGRRGGRRRARSAAGEGEASALPGGVQQSDSLVSEVAVGARPGETSSVGSVPVENVTTTAEPEGKREEHLTGRRKEWEYPVASSPTGAGESGAEEGGVVERARPSRPPGRKRDGGAVVAGGEARMEERKGTRAKRTARRGRGSAKRGRESAPELAPVSAEGTGAKKGVAEVETGIVVSPVGELPPGRPLSKKPIAAEPAKPSRRGWWQRVEG